MSETAVLWLFGTVIALQTTAIGAIVAALWAHVGHCKDVASRLAEVGTDVKRLKEDVGDHNHGLRGDIRAHTTAIFKLDARMELFERRNDQR